MGRLKKGAPPTYRRHKASGQAIVTINDDDIYLGKYDSPESKAEYARLIAEYALTGAVSREVVETEDQQVVQVLAAFWRFAQTWYRKDGELTNEVDAYRKVIEDVRALFGDTPASEFGPRAFKAVRQRWIDRGQARTTVNKNAGRLKRIFKWAAAEELVPISVHQSLTAVEGLRRGRCDCRESSRILPVDLAVVEATMPHLPKVTADMVRFQLLTGARPGEVCKLTPAGVDRSRDVWEYVVDGHKTEHHGRGRTVYIGPAAQAVLAPYLLRDASTVCFSMAESLEQRRQARAAARVTPLSCGNRRGKRSKADYQPGRQRKTPQVAFDAGTYRKAIHYACDVAFPAPEPLGQREGESNAKRLRRLTKQQQADLEAWQKEHRWSPNQLRHARATDIRKQFGLEAAQVILGHAAADVTQVYAERDADKAREVARAIG